VLYKFPLRTDYRLPEEMTTRIYTSTPDIMVAIYLRYTLSLQFKSRTSRALIATCQKIAQFLFVLNGLYSLFQ